jgi:hypothetical protein
VQQAPGVDHPALQQPAKAPALVGGHMGAADERRRVVEVGIGRGDVDVAGDDQGPATQGGQALGGRIEEGQLGRERRRAHGPPVGDVDADHPQWPHVHLQPAGLGRVGLARQAGGDLVGLQAWPEQHRHPAPAAPAVPDGGVAGPSQLQRERGAGRGLGLL